VSHYSIFTKIPPYPHTHISTKRAAPKVFFDLFWQLVSFNKPKLKFNDSKVINFPNSFLQPAVVNQMFLLVKFDSLIMSFGSLWLVTSRLNRKLMRLPLLFVILSSLTPRCQSPIRISTNELPVSHDYDGQARIHSRIQRLRSFPLLVYIREWRMVAFHPPFTLLVSKTPYFEPKRIFSLRLTL
jgi:hypothetical protein